MTDTPDTDHERARELAVAWNTYEPGQGVTSENINLARCYLDEQRYRIALEELTPSGSEYHRDLDRCVAYIRERLDRHHRLLVDEVRKRHDAEDRANRNNCEAHQACRGRDEARTEAARLETLVAVLDADNGAQRGFVSELEGEVARLREVLQRVANMSAPTIHNDDPVRLARRALTSQPSPSEPRDPEPLICDCDYRNGFIDGAEYEATHREKRGR